MRYVEHMRIAAAEAQGWSGPWRFGNEHLHGTPPNATKPVTGWMDDKHVPDVVDNLIIDLCYKISTLASGIHAVRRLMNESTGVAGLYKKGDVATWKELEEDGQFWEWLFEFNYAEHVIPKDKLSGQ